MARPPSPVEVEWFARWLGPQGSRGPLPPGHDHAVALLHPGSRRSRNGGHPAYVGPAAGSLAPEQKRLLSRLLLALDDSRTPATLATWTSEPHRRPAPPLDVAVRVRAEIDYLLIGGRVSSLVWATWEPRHGPARPLTALWPEDRSWCVWSDPRHAFTVLSGPAELCDRAREAPVLAADAWPHTS